MPKEKKKKERKQQQKKSRKNKKVLLKLLEFKGKMIHWCSECFITWKCWNKAIFSVLPHCDCQLNRRILICIGSWAKCSKICFWRIYIQILCLGFISQMGNFWGLVNIIKRAQTYLAAPVSNSTSTWILWWLWNNSVIFADLFALHFQWKWSRKKRKKERRNLKGRIEN